MKLWVGDLDGYIDIEASNRANEREAEEEAEEERLDRDLDEIGDVQLTAGKATSARELNRRGISPSEWRHAVHQAETAIRPPLAGVLVPEERDRRSDEGQFLRAMLDLGRSYAIAKYARWERLDFSSATTATLPHGIRALINQMLAAEGIERTRVIDDRIRGVLGADNGNRLIAYRRTGLLQATLHQIADEASGHAGGMTLDRDRMRIILSLARLQFSTAELRVSSIEQLRTSLAAYHAERSTVEPDNSPAVPHGRPIRAWRLRHVRPLLDLYPFAVRYGLHRLLEHEPKDHASQPDPFRVDKESGPPRELLVNELALARCGILLMRRAGRARTRSR